MTYTTKQGDMWDSIAYSQMGSCSYTDKLIQHNQEHHSVFVFPAGVVLQIPEVDTEEHADLPPWREAAG